MKRLRLDRGAALIEQAVTLLLVAGIVSSTIKFLGQNLQSSYENVEFRLASEINTEPPGEYRSGGDGDGGGESGSLLPRGNIEGGGSDWTINY